ncbi:MAG: ABC transporter substrate-binding protein [Litorilinea sp.]|nr:MAG: ABC transporter substrate-binding protein [Litorilinea sp.]
MRKVMPAETPRPQSAGGVGGRPSRLMLALVTCLALGLLLAACGRRGQTTPTPPPVTTAVAAESPNPAPSTPMVTPAGESAPILPTPTPTQAPTPVSGRLVLWHSWAQADGDALAAALERFQQRYPDVTVDTLFVADPDLLQSYGEAVQAGGGPDLVLAPNWWLGQMVAAGVVQPLDGLVDEAALRDYWPAALDSLRWQGRLYGLPIYMELVSLYYNRALVDEGRLPNTLDDLLALAQEDPRQGIGLYLSLYHLYWGIPAYGGQLLDADGRVVLDQNDGAARYLAWLVQADQTPGNFIDQDYGMLLDRFKKEEYAFFVDGPWSRDELQQALGEKLDVTLLPAGPVAPAQPWLNASGFFINPQASPEQQALALLFAREVSGPLGGPSMAGLARRLPAFRGAELGNDPILQGFFRQAAHAQALPAVPEMEQVWAYGGDMFLKVLAGGADPAQTVAETSALINEANGK